MRRPFKILSCCFLTFVGLSLPGCGVQTSAATERALYLDTTLLGLQVGQTFQFTAHTQEGSSSLSDWHSAYDEVASVDVTGRVTALTPGTTSVTATLGHRSAQAEVRVLAASAAARASLQGVLWEDANANGYTDGGERPLAGWSVFLDFNRDGLRQAGEPTRLTDDSGHYHFSDLLAGRYAVVIGLEPGFEAGLSKGDASLETNLIGASESDTYLVSPGQGMDGVVRLELPVVDSNEVKTCTGSLLTGSYHVITAAHCLSDASGQLNIRSPRVHLYLPSGRRTLTVSRTLLHPQWSGDVMHGNDIALLELTRPAPLGADRYPLYRQNADIGETFTKAGYGGLGVGHGGEVQPNTRQQKLQGRNRFDADNGILLGTASYTAPVASQLVYDFDSGDRAHDTLGARFGLRDLGVGWDEVFPATGDSGSPAFVGGRLAGVTSIGLAFGPGSPDSSFGEVAVDTRVSYYHDWIDKAVAQSGLELVDGQEVVIGLGEVAIRSFPFVRK